MTDRTISDQLDNSPGNELPLLQRRIRVARGDEPGDLLLDGGSVVNVFTGQIEPANVVIADGWIAGVGPHQWEAQERISVDGQAILPGLVDAHMHLESTLLLPAELAAAVVPQGTAMIIADPHEIANVLGVQGIDMMLAASEGLPLDIFFMAPSCVPATDWEDAGAVLNAEDIRGLLERERILGLGEMMNFPAVLAAQPAVLEKVLAASQKCVAVDGHAPFLMGQQLVAYVAAGIRADHESTMAEEAAEKAALGMMVQVREGSSEHNLDTMLPLILEDKLGDWCLASDDILPGDIAQRGHINGLLRRIVAAGVPAARAVRHATLVPARHYGFVDRGAVAPGYRADLAVVGDLAEFEPALVIHHGTVVARDGECLQTVPSLSALEENTVRMGAITESDFSLATSGKSCPIIQIVPNQIITKHETADVPSENGNWGFSPDHDLALVACIERHRATGRIGLALARGFRFQRDGALGSSVAHDSHNLIIAGTNARDMLVCARALESNGGGFVVAADGQVQAELPLPVAGLMSSSDADTVRNQLDQVHEAAANLGCPLASPFGTLSFLALPVIPELRITTKGLFDVSTQQFVAYK